MAILEESAGGDQGHQVGAGDRAPSRLSGFDQLEHHASAAAGLPAPRVTVGRIEEATVPNKITDSPACSRRRAARSDLEEDKVPEFASLAWGEAGRPGRAGRWR
ncbi:hypothetical protein GCM10017687_30170 [Streptomyces echinatus]